jgi:hypothetical protein
MGTRSDISQELYRALWRCYEHMLKHYEPCADRKCVHDSCACLRLVAKAKRVSAV